MASEGASGCDVEPISLPLADLQVDPDISDSFMRGIRVKIGSPEQSLVVLPWAELNNTWLYDSHSKCDKSIIFTTEICRIRRGAYFEAEASTSFLKHDDIIAAGGATQEADDEGPESGIGALIASSLGGTDKVTLGSSLSILDFPVGMPRQNWDHGYTILHAMGMGSNSTLLSALSSTRKIASRVWSIWWGRMWVDESQAFDGSVVLGGYDFEKVTGQNVTSKLDYSPDTGCWTGMPVTITQVTANFRDGSLEGIFDPNTTLRCCLVPHNQLLWAAPNSMVNRFEEVSGPRSRGVSYGLHWSARVFDAADAFDGDVTFTLDSGMRIRVPNDQYIVPFTEVNHEGRRIFNTSRRELLMNGLGKQPPTLGRYFLTAAYLMVDHDVGTFTLWQANPSTKSRLVPIAHGKERDCPDASISDADGGQDATAIEGPGSDSDGMSAIAIAGVVVGSVLGVAVLVVGLWCLALRRRRGSWPFRTEPTPEMLQVSETVPPLESDVPKCVANGQDAVTEMPGSPTQRPRSELPGHDRFVYELDGDHGS